MDIKPNMFNGRCLCSGNNSLIPHISGLRCECNGTLTQQEINARLLSRVTDVEYKMGLQEDEIKALQKRLEDHKRLTRAWVAGV